MYHLEKYKGPSTRHTCPKCGERRQFTYYVDDAGNILNELVGMCNNVNRCGYHYTPKQYFADNPDKMPHPVDIDKITTPPAPKQICYFPAEYVERSKSEESNFVANLYKLFDEATIHRLTEDYELGATKQREVIFWQIDKDGRPRTGKIMQYYADRLNRVRNTDTGDAVNWCHSQLKKRRALPEDWELSQCLFGEHLLTRYPDKVVIVTESEKSAIIGAGAFPNYVWVATGGCGNFKAGLLHTLTGRRVIVFPDIDAHKEWSDRAERFTFCRMQVSSYLIDNVDTEAMPKADIADILIPYLMEHRRPQAERINKSPALSAMLAGNPAISDLINTYKLREI